MLFFTVKTIRTRGSLHKKKRLGLEMTGEEGGQGIKLQPKEGRQGALGPTFCRAVALKEFGIIFYSMR